MKCPVCGEEMKKGEVANSRGDRIFWAPTEFFEKHMMNPNTHMKNTIVKEGGIIIKIKNRVLSKPTVGYACEKCQVVLIDCK